MGRQEVFAKIYRFVFKYSFPFAHSLPLFQKESLQCLDGLFLLLALLFFPFLPLIFSSVTSRTFPLLPYSPTSPLISSMLPLADSYSNPCSTHTSKVRCHPAQWNMFSFCYEPSGVQLTTIPQSTLPLQYLVLKQWN